MTVDTSAPRLANAAERRVHKLLVEQLGDDGVVIAGKRVTDHLKDHEIDSFAISPGNTASCRAWRTNYPVEAQLAYRAAAPSLIGLNHGT